MYILAAARKAIEWLAWVWQWKLASSCRVHGVASEEQGGSPEWQGNCAQAFGSCLRGKERKKKENRNEYQSMH